MLRRRGLLVGIAADQVTHIRRTLDQVGNGMQVDHLPGEEIPAVDDEVDVEPDLRNIGDQHGVDFRRLGGIDNHVIGPVRHVSTRITGLPRNFLGLGRIGIEDLARAAGRVPSFTLLADGEGKADRDAGIAVHPVVDVPMRLGGFLHIQFPVEVVGDQGAPDIQHQLEVVGQPEFVDETDVGRRAGDEFVPVAMVKGHNETAADVTVNGKEAVRVIAADQISPIHVENTIQIGEPAALIGQFHIVILGIGPVIALRCLEIGA